MPRMNTFAEIPERPVFPDEEEKVLHRWNEIKAFEQCLEDSKEKPPYIFYDGPPFATGTPHYGHILAGTIKDIVCRYQHQRGKYVHRRWGWDCHGLPIEHIIDKAAPEKFGRKIESRQDVFDIGVDVYNEECRKVVLQYADEWKKIVARFGRWIDMEKPYKTMDPEFMESTWYCFKRLFDQGKVYQAFRVMPFSYALHTPLSNFEVAQGYKEGVLDPSIIIRVKVIEKSFQTNELLNDIKGKAVYIIAWTTTPWTLPSNLNMCVHPTHEYVFVEVKTCKKAPSLNNTVMIVGKERMTICMKDCGLEENEYSVIKGGVPGEKLAGIAYEPIFPYWVKN